MELMGSIGNFAVCCLAQDHVKSNTMGSNVLAASSVGFKPIIILLPMVSANSVL